MKCPICKEGDLDDQDGELVCQGDCGSAFALEYVGTYGELHTCERVDDGFESKVWLGRWKEKRDKFKFEGL